MNSWLADVVSASSPGTNECSKWGVREAPHYSSCTLYDIPIRSLCLFIYLPPPLSLSLPRVPQSSQKGGKIRKMSFLSPRKKRKERKDQEMWLPKNLVCLSYFLKAKKSCGLVAKVAFSCICHPALLSGVWPIISSSEHLHTKQQEGSSDLAS